MGVHCRAEVEVFSTGFDKLGGYCKEDDLVDSERGCFVEGGLERP